MNLQQSQAKYTISSVLSQALAEPSARASSLPPVEPGAGGGAAPAGYLEAPPRCPYSPAPGDLPYRVVGFRKLRDLLQPKHAYFSGHQGYIKKFSCYDAGDAYNLYPRVKIPGGSRKNPYRKHQLRSKHTQATIKKLLALREIAKLDDFKVAVVIPTFPRELSEWLSRQPHGTEMAWRLFNRFWANVYSKLEDDSNGQAAYVNLHTWKTEEPTIPHFHFHAAIPNYCLAESADILDPDGHQGYEFKKKAWHKQRGGTEVPFTDKGLDAIKWWWHALLVKFAIRHGVREFVPGDWQDIDVFVDFVSWADEVGKAKLMNKLNYQSRHWIEDYARYSSNHLDCPEPPVWLEGYNNATRTFGWWKHLKSLTAGVELGKAEVLSPVTGEAMKYVGALDTNELLVAALGRVGTLDFVKGSPVYGTLSQSDIDWLRQVTVKGDPPAGRRVTYVRNDNGQ